MVVGNLQFLKQKNLKRVAADGFRSEIPKEWEVVKLDSIVEIYDSKRIPLSEQERSKRKGPYPYCGATGIIDYIDDYIFDGEYVLLAEDGGYFGPFERSAYIMSGKFWVNNHAHILRAKDEVAFNWYLMYVLNYVDLKPYIVGSTRTKLNQADMRRIKVPLPPLPEQQKIAHVLRSIDKAIEAVDEAIAKAERIKKGLMQEFLTKGIGHRKFKDTEIGRIPKEWEVVKLDSIVEIYDSKRIPLSEQERSKRKGPYPYCGATGIIDYIDDYIFNDEYVLLAEDGGYFGPFEQSAYIMSGKFWANNHVHILRTKNGVSNNWYLMYVLNYMDLRPYIVGSTRAKLNQEYMRKIKVLLPPFPEQQKIAEILSKWDKIIGLKKEKKEKLERMKKKVMELLLTGKVRVK